MTILAFITGLPGSGKTYLGHEIKNNIKNVKVLDTDKLKDKFLESNDPIRLEFAEQLSQFDSLGKKTEEQKNLEIDYTLYYKKVLTKKFKKLNKSKTNYVIVGQLFLFDMFYHSVPAKQKYFLNVDPATTFIRRNTRWLKNLNKNKKYFKNLISEGNEFWNFNKLWNFTNYDFIENEYKTLKKFYQKKGYRVGLNEKIINNIKKLVK